MRVRKTRLWHRRLRSRSSVRRQGGRLMPADVGGWLLPRKPLLGGLGFGRFVPLGNKNAPNQLWSSHKLGRTPRFPERSVRPSENATWLSLSRHVPETRGGLRY